MKIAILVLIAIVTAYTVMKFRRSMRENQDD